jgi:hypothetical protein
MKSSIPLLRIIKPGSNGQVVISGLLKMQQFVVHPDAAGGDRHELQTVRTLFPAELLETPTAYRLKVHNVFSIIRL